MPKIIFRLLLSFIVFVSVFVVIQQFLTPESFGDYGHYRANSINDNIATISIFKGEDECAKCHTDIFDLKDSDLHSGVSCESCHYPKIDANTDCKVNPPVVIGSIKFCIQCHELNAAREAIRFPNLDIQDHKGDQNCIECHNAHAPWELKE